MLKLKDILLEQKKRSIEIKGRKFNSLLDKFYGNKKDAILNNAAKIYRGIRNAKQNYLYIQPSKYIRKSANTENYYTLIIDNSKYWKEYPKRSKSIICSTLKYSASDFGHFMYQVYPKIGARIGICPEEDIWYSFGTGLNLINKMFDLENSGSTDLKSFNYFL